MQLLECLENCLGFKWTGPASESLVTPCCVTLYWVHLGTEAPHRWTWTVCEASEKGASTRPMMMSLVCLFEILCKGCFCSFPVCKYKAVLYPSSQEAFVPYLLGICKKSISHGDWPEFKEYRPLTQNPRPSCLLLKAFNWIEPNLNVPGATRAGDGSKPLLGLANSEVRLAGDLHKSYHSPRSLPRVSTASGQKRVWFAARSGLHTFPPVLQCVFFHYPCL